MSTIKDILAKHIQSEQKHHSDCLAKLAIAEKDLEKNEFHPNKITWNIILNPFSARSGGKSIDFKYRGKLQNAIKRAEQEFLRRNSHSDISSCLVIAIIAGVCIPIPKEYWNTPMSSDETWSSSNLTPKPARFHSSWAFFLAEKNLINKRFFL